MPTCDDAGLHDVRPNLDIGKLPVIKVIRLDSLLFHEEPDEDRWMPLTRRIAADGFLKNPPIAAGDHGTASHILLDGVNRIEALKNLGAQFALIQEVGLDDESLTLSTWHHVAEGLDGKDTVAKLKRELSVAGFDGEFTPGGDFVPRFRDNAVSLITLPDRQCFAVRSDGGPERQLAAVNRVAELVHTAKNRDRVSYTNMDDLARHYGEFSALVCYRDFSKADVFRLAVRGLRFPSGVTRFSVPKRALSFNMPLDFLKAPGTTEAKEAELQEIMGKKIHEKRIRFYVEPTFYFDE